jgi:hypothetical protein
LSCMPSLRRRRRTSASCRGSAGRCRSRTPTRRRTAGAFRSPTATEARSPAPDRCHDWRHSVGCRRSGDLIHLRSVDLIHPPTTPGTSRSSASRTAASTTRAAPSSRWPRPTAPSVSTCCPSHTRAARPEQRSTSTRRSPGRPAAKQSPSSARFPPPTTRSWQAGSWRKRAATRVAT